MYCCIWQNENYTFDINVSLRNKCACNLLFLGYKNPIDPFFKICYTFSSLFCCSAVTNASIFLCLIRNETAQVIQLMYSLFATTSAYVTNREGQRMRLTVHLYPVRIFFYSSFK